MSKLTHLHILGDAHVASTQHPVRYPAGDDEKNEVECLRCNWAVTVLRLTEPLRDDEEPSGVVVPDEGISSPHGPLSPATTRSGAYGGLVFLLPLFLVVFWMIVFVCLVAKYN